MDYIMTDEDMRLRINKGVRWIANSVFCMADETSRYMKAYDKLLARFALDYGYSLSDRLKSSKSKDTTVFDILIGDELKMLLQSQIRLENMYVEVMEKKNKINSLRKRKEMCYG